MPTCATFRIGDYAAPGDCFHLARKALPQVPGPLHDHDCHELFWIESGYAEHVVRQGGRTLPPGACVFMRPEDVHRLYAVAGEPCTILNIMFPSETVHHFRSRYGELVAGRYFWSDDKRPDTRLLDRAQLARLGRLSDPLLAGRRDLVRLESFLLDLIAQVLDVAPALPAEVPAWLADACRAAHDPSVFRQGASGFVAVAGKSHAHVCRAARQHLGASPSGYVNRLRMEHAARLLSGSQRGITEIVLDCGIDNISHFYRLFRREFSMTPRAYREQYGRRLD